MKLFKYIAISLLFLSVFSCQKEIIKPCSSINQNQERPKAKMIGEIETNNSDSIETLSSISSTTSTNEDGLGDASEENGEGQITDPNNDPDSNKKKGNRK